MTNEERARVLSVKASCEVYFDEEAQKQYLNPRTDTIARINAYGACMEMAKWKDEQFTQEKQQWIDKTTKWLEEQDFGGWIESETDDLINDFKQFAKEEL